MMKMIRTLYLICGVSVFAQTAASEVHNNIFAPVPGTWTIDLRLRWFCCCMSIIVWNVRSSSSVSNSSRRLWRGNGYIFGMLIENIKFKVAGLQDRALVRVCLPDCDTEKSFLLWQRRVFHPLLLYMHYRSSKVRVQLRMIMRSLVVISLSK